MFRKRPHTLAPGRLRRLVLLDRDDELAVDLPVRPGTRGECSGSLRPCPFVSCRHHLYLEVSRTSGSLKINFPHLEVWQLGESCSLDVAERGGHSLGQVGPLINVTRERVRQLVDRAVQHLRENGVGEVSRKPRRRRKRRKPTR